MMKMMLKNWKTGFQKPVFGFQHIPKHESQLGSSPQFFSSKEPKNQNLPKTHVFKPIGMCNTLEKLKKWNNWFSKTGFLVSTYFNLFQPIPKHVNWDHHPSSAQQGVTARPHLPLRQVFRKHPQSQCPYEPWRKSKENIHHMIAEYTFINIYNHLQH